MNQTVVPTGRQERRPYVDDLYRRIARGADPASNPRTLRRDVEKDDHAYRIRVEVPGVRKQDVGASVDVAVVTIHAGATESRCVADTHEGPLTLVDESGHGDRWRTVRLPHEIDVKGVQARLEHGIPTLNCPKRSSGKRDFLAVG